MDLHRIKGPTFCQPVQQPDGIAALIRILSQIMIQIQSLYFDSIVLRGARMRAIRQERKISVKQVMEYMGFESTQAVYKWEAGKCFPQADNLIALAILYRVSPMELLVEEDLVPSSSHIWGNAA